MWLELGQIGYTIGALLAVAFGLAVVTGHNDDDARK
jgi:hypothetical protein